MKKLLSVILALLLFMSFSIMMVTSVSAGEVEDSLVIHYDFEGDTIEEKLKDKATAGQASDDLILQNITKDDNFLMILFEIRTYFMYNGKVVTKEGGNWIE